METRRCCQVHYRIRSTEVQLNRTPILIRYSIGRITQSTLRLNCFLGKPCNSVASSSFQCSTRWRGRKKELIVYKIILQVLNNPPSFAARQGRPRPPFERQPRNNSNGITTAALRQTHPLQHIHPSSQAIITTSGHQLPGCPNNRQLVCQVWVQKVEPLVPTRNLNSNIPRGPLLYPLVTNSLSCLAIDVWSTWSRRFSSISAFVLTYSYESRVVCCRLRNLERILAPYCKLSLWLRTSTSQWVSYRESGSGCLKHQSFPRSMRTSQRYTRVPPGWRSSGDRSGWRAIPAYPSHSVWFCCSHVL